jgi:carboxyl-terminal processing protease
MLDNENLNEQNQSYPNNNNKGNSKIKWITMVVLLLVVSNGITAFISSKVSFNVSKKLVNNVTNSSEGIAMNDSRISIDSNIDKEDIEQFNKLFVVKDKLEKYYNGEIDEDLLVESAIKGMVNSLEDPYTVFMNQKQFEYLTTETEGTYVGLGIQVGVIENKIVIIAPFEDSPAKKAGLQSGDIIEKVNGLEVKGVDLEKAVSIMKGKKGEKVDLTINRENKGNMDFTVKRDEIQLVTVRGEMIEDKIGYLQIFMFDENTGKNVSKKLKQLDDEGMESLIIDLRENPGGLVSQCVDVTSNFIPKGDVIVSTIDKYKNKKEYLSEGGKYTEIPITILTDGGTASSSEILSGALRDYGRATLVGTKTFGKGLVQSVFYRKIDGFGDGTALKVTVSDYYTPNGENINKKGIEPNIVIEYPKELYEQNYNRELDPQFQKALDLAREKLNNK